MQFSKQISVMLAIAVTSFASTSFGQQDGRDLFKECLQAQAREFLPLAQERDAVYQEFSNRSSSIRNVLLWLEDDYKSADAKRLQKITALETQLKALKEYANLTSAEATRDVEATVKTANAMLQDISEQQDRAIKPFSRKLTVLQRKYLPQETTLTPVVFSLFREKGNSESTANLVRSYDTFSYSSGTASGTYFREGEDKSAAICYIYLFNNKVGKKEYGLFLGKYPIAYQNRNQLEVLVGTTRVTIYAAEKGLGGKQIKATLSSLIDIEKLEAMLAP